MAVAAGTGNRLLRRVGVPPGITGSTRQSLGTVALGWLVVAVLASVPFLTAARLGQSVGAEVRSGAVFVDPWSALFEGMSAVTSTGLTMVEAERQLPHAPG